MFVITENSRRLNLKYIMLWKKAKAEDMVFLMKNPLNNILSSETSKVPQKYHMLPLIIVSMVYQDAKISFHRECTL